MSHDFDASTYRGRMPHTRECGGCGDDIPMAESFCPECKEIVKDRNDRIRGKKRVRTTPTAIIVEHDRAADDDG